MTMTAMISLMTTTASDYKYRSSGSDVDGLGDLCDEDDDGDNVLDADETPVVANTDQADLMKMVQATCATMMMTTSLMQTTTAQ